MIDKLIYYLLVIVIPLRSTYFANKYNKSLHKWGIYWALYATLVSLTELSPTYLDNYPMHSFILLTSVWLYSYQFQGANYLMEKLKQNRLCQNLIVKINQTTKDMKLKVSGFETVRVLDKNN